MNAEKDKRIEALVDNEERIAFDASDKGVVKRRYFLLVSQKEPPKTDECPSLLELFDIAGRNTIPENEIKRREQHTYGCRYCLGQLSEIHDWIDYCSSRGMRSPVKI